MYKCLLHSNQTGIGHLYHIDADSALIMRDSFVFYRKRKIVIEFSANSVIAIKDCPDERDPLLKSSNRYYCVGDINIADFHNQSTYD